jgi:Holliday junction resolvase RusA-like endonuclease
MIVIEIPRLPLSVNKCFATHKGHRITTREYKAFMHEVERCLPDANPDWSGAYTRLSVDIELYSANWFTQKGVRKVDIDNFLKSCLDSIFKHYAFDDSAIFHLNVQKLGTEFGDKTIVKIAHMDNN